MLYLDRPFVFSYSLKCRENTTIVIFEIVYSFEISPASCRIQYGGRVSTKEFLAHKVEPTAQF